MMPPVFSSPAAVEKGLQIRAVSRKHSVIKWDLSPDSEGVQYATPAPSSRIPSRFKVCALTVQASLRFRRMMRIKLRLLRGTPVSRLRSCVYMIVCIIRLRTTLPQIRARRRRYLRSLQGFASKHTFRTYGMTVVFCCGLIQKLHERHVQCSPLDTAIETVSEALNFKLDKVTNAGKCMALLQLFSSVSTHLNIMRFVFDNLKGPLDTGAYKGLSVCYYSVKELCRVLSMCKQYIQDCTGFLESRRVFVKLENIHTVKFLLLELYQCSRILLMRFDEFGKSMPDPISEEFTWDCSPPCLPGSFMGHYLHLQAKKDLEEVRANLNEHPKSHWSAFMIGWKNILSASEDIALRDLLLARLNYPIVGDGDVGFLKKGMFVDKKHIRWVRFVGSGSYGKVDEVLCFGEKYAMKTMKGLRTVEHANEAVVQARLHHPNVVKLMWYTQGFDSQDSLSLLMDLMTTSLEDYIEQQIHSTPSRLFNYPLVSLHIMMQIAKAMEYLHSQGIMHRDLKAANVLVDGTWSPDTFNEGYVHVKVADFGLAKVKRAGSKTAMHTWKVGTRFWRAPEVFWQERSSSTDDLTSMSSKSSTEDPGGSSSDVPNYSFPADVYSYAMTCYEIVTGKKPFADILESEITERVLKERIVKSHQRPTLPPSVHPGLKDLIERCWDGTPGNRPTFDAICQELDQIKDDFVFGSQRYHLQDAEK